MNNDYFYQDDDKIYNLKYTHKQLTDLLEKLEHGEVLSKEQYKQLIEDIGLDNISTFDLNFYNLKNVPPIPVRTSELFNDSGFDYKNRVDIELQALEDLVVNEIDRIDLVLQSLTAMNIEDTLAKVETANERVDTLMQDIYNLNGVIFSFERTIESVEDTTNEVKIEFETLRNMQETDELRLDNIQEIIQIHTDDIQELLNYYESERKKLSETILVIDNIKAQINNLNEYQAIVKNIDIRLSVLEEFKSITDVNLINKLIEDVQIFKDKTKELRELYNELDEKLIEVDIKLIEGLYDMDRIIVSMNTIINRLSDTIDRNSEQIKLCKQSIDNINIEIDATQDDISDLKETIISIQDILGTLQSKLNSNDIWCKETETSISTINNKVVSIDRELALIDNDINIIQKDIDLLKNRISSLEEQALTFATKALVNSLALDAQIKEEEELITINLILDGKSLSSIDIPFLMKKEEEKDRIARTMNAWINYSIITSNETVDRTARVDKGTTDYSTTN